jgi:DNA-directed RNA polymerase specialized sigma24 family protein
MADRELSSVLGRIAAAADRGSGGVCDAHLLERFVGGGDEAAFELLVWRHARLVFGVCRRVLGNAHDAEDAFQAVFLALARKAGAIGKRAALAGWLYRVACRVSLNARADRARRAARERPSPSLGGVPAPAETSPSEGREVRALVDE